MQLGYTVPAAVSRKLFIERLRAYVSLDDFITFTKYPGCDPETATSSNGQSNTASSAGYDNGTYPQSRKFTVGLNVTF